MTLPNASHIADHGVMWHAALVRVLGKDAAEIPIVATRPQLRARGLAKRLLAAVEESLKGAGVARITMPAIRAPGVPSLSVLPCLSLGGYHSLLLAILGTKLKLLQGWDSCKLVMAHQPVA